MVYANQKPVPIKWERLDIWLRSNGWPINHPRQSMYALARTALEMLMGSFFPGLA